MSNPVHAYASPPSRRRRRALSTVEMLVTMGVLALLTGFSFILFSGARRGRAQAACVSNLHSIGVSFNLYLSEYGDTYPAPNRTAQWEDMLRNYIPRSTFHCPADFELFSSLGSSYDWRDTGNPLTTLAGKPAMQVSRGGTVLVYDALPGWHSPGTVQVIKVDDAVELMDQTVFFQDLQKSPSK